MNPLFLLLCNLSWATIFVPINFDAQIKDSNLIIQGFFLEKSSRQLPSGQLITESTFKITKAFEGELTEPVLKILTPGGKLGDIVQIIDGTPEFAKDEEVILLLKKSPDGFWIHNLALGKYNLKREGERTFLQSSIFPKDPKLSKIPYDNFEQIVFSHFRKKFISVDFGNRLKTSQKTEITKLSSEITDRKVANNNSDDFFNYKIIGVIFFVIFSFVGIFRLKKRLRK